MSSAALLQGQQPASGPGPRPNHAGAPSAVNQSKIHTSGSRLRKYRLRSSLNIIGAALYTGFYAFIVWYYIEAPIQNGITEHRILSAKAIYYAWFLVSVFALDWAHAGTAIVEIAAVVSRYLAPQTALHTLWHSERSWSGPTGWMKAICTAISLWIMNLTRGSPSSHDKYRCGPSRLWWLLTVINIPIWIAVPLSGLSFDFGRSLVADSSLVQISGVNQSSFETRSPSYIWQKALEKWALGGPVTPPGSAVLYAPSTVGEADGWYYEDAITNHDASETITFFSGPSVSARAQGRTWGILTSVKAQPVHPSNLTMMSVTSYSNWTSRPGFGPPARRLQFGPTYGANGAFVLKSNGTMRPVYTERVEGYDSRFEFSDLPETTLVEIVLWQYYKDVLAAVNDWSMIEMLSSGYVMQEPFHDAAGENNMFMAAVDGMPKPLLLSYGLSIEVKSAVGFADVSAHSNIFTNFTVARSEPHATLSEMLQQLKHVDSSFCRRRVGDMPRYNPNGTDTFNASSIGPDVLLICQDQIVLTEFLRTYIDAAITLANSAGGRMLSIGDMLYGAIACAQVNGLFDGYNTDALFITTPLPSPSCPDIWMSANSATGGVPYIVKFKMLTGQESSGQPMYRDVEIPFLRMPALTPERLRLAMLKLLGEIAIAMTGPAQESHFAGLTGFSETTILRPGVIPWQFILALLLLWTLLFMSSTVFYFNSPRLGPSLGAYQLFRFGAEWHQDLTEKLSVDCDRSKSLSQIPNQAELRQARTQGHFGFVGVTSERLARRNLI